MKTNVTLLIFLVFVSKFAFSQKEIKPDIKNHIPNRIFAGGNIGLQFGTVTLIDISPLVGYWITENLAAAVGFTYQYYKDGRFIPEYSTNVFGARIFGRYYFFDDFFGHAEYEWLNYEAYSLIDGLDRINVNNILLGGGYRQWVSRNSFVSIAILWNVNETIYSLYQNPIIRIGINVGL